MAGCPHKDKLFCPLYEAAHIAGGPSCDDGHLDEHSCAVDRGVSYSELVGALMAKHPGIVEQNRWNEQLAERSAQRSRNLRLNGIH